jgi:hypothetical protein
MLENTMKPRILLSAVVVSLFSIVPFLGGCEVNPPIEARQDPYPRQQVHLTSKDLRWHTAVDTPQVWRDDAGLLFITLQITVNSTTPLAKDFQVDLRYSQ